MSLPASPAPALAGKDRRLDARLLVDALLAARRIDASEAQRLHGLLSLSALTRHAAVELAQRRPRAAEGGTALDLDALLAFAAAQAGLPLLRIDPLAVQSQRVQEVMSLAYATRHRILPVEVTRDAVTIAVAEPFDTAWVDELSQLMRRQVRRVLASPLDIDRYAVEFFALARSVKDAARRGIVTGTQDFEQLVELGRSGRNLDANDRHVVTIVDWLWQYAFDQRASDIHLEPRREQGSIRFRIDGVLHTVYQVPQAVMNAMVSRIKLLGRMDVVEKRRPQDGRIKTRTAAGQEVELRLSTLPTAFGEKLVMRIFDPEVLQREFSELGLPEDDLARWNALVARPNGIVLVTGPTGSGKTTTLYSTLRRLATEQVNVCTVEDPIEMVEPAFNQMQVQHGIDLGFADGVRALMRQDPDIVMVGEIRDLETAEMAVQAALTGHLVLSTLHTNDAPSAVTRLLDLGVAPYLLQATLAGVMAQRLVRTLCPHCRQPGPAPDEARWQALSAPFKARPPAQGWHAPGCIECRMTGFRGRAGLYELLTMTEALRGFVTEKPDIAALREQAMRDGMRPLRVAGAMKVAAGLTTIDEVLQAAPPAGG